MMNKDTIIIILIIAIFFFITFIIRLLYEVRRNDENSIEKEKLQEYLYDELLNEVELYKDYKNELSYYFLYLLKKEGLTSLEKIDNYKLADWKDFYEKNKSFKLYDSDFQIGKQFNTYPLEENIIKLLYINYKKKYGLPDEKSKDYKTLESIFSKQDFKEVYKGLEEYKENKKGVEYDEKEQRK